jgi:hypothetical protein
LIRVPYWVPFYFDMVEAHLFVGRPAGSVLKYFSKVLYQEPWSYIFSSLPSRVLESTVLPAWMNLFLQRLDSMGQPMGGHADSCQAFLLQKIDQVGQGSDLGEHEWSWFIAPSSLELGESAYKWWEARLVVLAIEPCPMESPKRLFWREVEEASARVSLNSHSPMTFWLAAIG